ncbi:MAG: entericidin EcnA/B family protein [Gemmobacter sp.]
MTKVLAMVALVFTLGACNTVDGVGQDISGAASRIGSWR